MSDDTLTMLADAAAAFARPDAKRVRRLRGTERSFEAIVWRRMADQGWLSVLVPEARGGLGLGQDAAAVIAQRIGYAGLPEPYVAAGVLTTTLLAGCEDGPALARLLEEVMSGQRIVVAAWQNDDGALAPARAAITARDHGADTVLDGSCRFVRVASADAFIVAARGADGLALYCVERDRAGLTMTAEPAADGSANARLVLAGVKVGPSERLAGPDRAQAALETAIEAAVLATSAELVGIMERVLELTFEYLKTRKQFGKPIGSFQALQHRAVDIWIQKELSKAALGASLARFDAPGASARERSLAASSAKARAAEAAMLVCKQAVQLHGAIGYTDEYDLSLYFNRALVLCAWLGNGAAQRRRYGELTRGEGQ